MRWWCYVATVARLKRGRNRRGGRSPIVIWELGSLLKTRFTLDRVGYRISFVFFFLFADDVIRRVLRSACFPLHLRNAFDSSEEEQKRNKQINAEDEVVSIWLYHRQICFPFDVSSPFCLGFVVEQSFYFTVSFISISRKEAEVKQK